MASAEQSECLVESIDKIDHVIACSVGISRDLLGKICALDRDGWYKPRAQSSQSEKANHENKSHRRGATERAARHFRQQRVEQIHENHGDGDGDQDWLEG